MYIRCVQAVVLLHLHQATVMVSKHIHSLRHIRGTYTELEEDQDTLYFQIKLYDSRTYSDFMVHRLSYHSDSYHSDIVCAPESAPSLFFKSQLLAFALLRQ